MHRYTQLSQEKLSHIQTKIHQIVCSIQEKMKKFEKKIERMTLEIAAETDLEAKEILTEEILTLELIRFEPNAALKWCKTLHTQSLKQEWLYLIGFASLIQENHALLDFVIEKEANTDLKHSLLQLKVLYLIDRQNKPELISILRELPSSKQKNALLFFAATQGLGQVSAAVAMDPNFKTEFPEIEESFDVFELLCPPFVQSEKYLDIFDQLVR